MRLCLLYILFAFTLQDSFACSCHQPLDFSLYEYYLNEEIFLGNCVNAEKDTANYLYTNYTFEILESYKGAKKKTISIQSAHAGGMCGSKFIPGNRYLIFATGGRTGSCSGNFALDSDSLNLLNIDSELGLTLKDTMRFFSGSEVMRILNNINRAKLNILRKIANTNTGVVSSYFINGDLNSTITLKDGILNGDAEFYYQNRKLKFKGCFENGKKQGLCEEYKLSVKKDYSGYIFIKEWGEYKNDERIGIWNYKVMEGKYQESIESISEPERGDEGQIQY